MAEVKGKGRKGSNKQKKASFYKVDSGKLQRLRKSCSKCGGGVFMSQHKDRDACGNCGFTEWKGR